MFTVYIYISKSKEGYIWISFPMFFLFCFCYAEVGNNPTTIDVKFLFEPQLVALQEYQKQVGSSCENKDPFPERFPAWASTDDTTWLDLFHI